jgi:hypothetical protein
MQNPDSYIVNLSLTKEQQQDNGATNLTNKQCWSNRTSTYKKKKITLDTELTSFTKVNSKWIIDLNANTKL